MLQIASDTEFLNVSMGNAIESRLAIFIAATLMTTLFLCAQPVMVYKLPRSRSNNYQP